MEFLFFMNSDLLTVCKEVFQAFLADKINLQSFFEKGKKIRGNSHEFIMKTAPGRGGTQYTSSYTVFGIFFFAFKSRFSKSEKNAGKTRENDKKAPLPALFCGNPAFFGWDLFRPLNLAAALGFEPR